MSSGRNISLKGVTYATLEASPGLKYKEYHANGCMTPDE
jgi:hypothetical protein